MKRNHSHSSLACWRRCKMKFHLQHRLGVVTPSGLGQRRGTAGHTALAYYYQHERDVDGALAEAKKSYFADEKVDSNIEDFGILIECLYRYFDYAENNDRFNVKEVEWKFELDIEGHPFVGFIDAIVEEKGQIWLMEHKFHKKVSVNHLDFDPQVSVYMMASLLSDIKPAGVIYNIIRVSDGKTAKNEPVVRKRIYRSADGLVYFAKELVQQMEEAEAFIKNNSPAYRTLTPDCSWDCSFLNVCMELNDSGDADYLIDRYERRNSKEEIDG